MAHRILIVDDEPDVARYLATALAANGYETKVANTAKRGEELLDEFRPHLVCLDIMMPLESGISMYVQMRRDRQTASVPVVMISGVETEKQFDFRGYVPDDDVPPPNSFLEKPLAVDDLISTVTRLIGPGKERHA